MSSTPTHQDASHLLYENGCEDDDEAAQHTEAFLASLLYDATHEDDRPVEVIGLMMSQDLLMTDDECASHVKAAPDEAAKTAAPQGHSRSGDSTPATTTFFHELLNRTRNRRPSWPPCWSCQSGCTKTGRKSDLVQDRVCCRAHYGSGVGPARITHLPEGVHA